MSEASAINNPGEIVGWSSTSAGTRHAVRWTPRPGGGGYDPAQDLGTLGGLYSWATAINDLGEIVGVSQDAGGARRAFLWTSTAGMTALGSVSGSTWCEANDINDRSQVVGYCTVGVGSLSTNRPVLWSNGQVRDLDASRGGSGIAMGINDRGDVYGSVREQGLALWSGTTRTILAGTNTTSYGDVNDRREVVGNWSNFSDHARLFTPTAEGGGYEETDLGAFAGDVSVAYDINERGDVVGFSYTADATRGFLWDRGTMTEIGTLGGPNSPAYGINDRSEVVGQSHLATLELHAYYWDRGTITDLGTL
ncbi:hypothetical protein [Micromonospora narathiwatensis]|nr:hypothetical protein [Micromonospora narathiwatensis]